MNCKGGFYGTALHAAACEGNEKAVTLLIASGVDVGAEDGYLGTALIAAVHHEHRGIVSKLLQANLSAHMLSFRIEQDPPCPGVELYDRVELYDTALDVAAASGYKDIVKQLLQAGAKEVWQALVAAAAHDQGSIVSLLLAAGAILEEVGYKGKSWSGKHVGLMRAIEFSFKREDEDHMTRGVNIIQTLIDASADVHEGNAAGLRKIEDSIEFMVRIEERSRQGHPWNDEKASKQAAKKAYLERLVQLLDTDGTNAQAQSDPLNQDVE